MRKIKSFHSLPVTILISAFYGLSIVLASGTSLELLSVKRIWDKAPHSAFTDLILVKDVWYCVFREGSSHVPGSNGTIRLIKSKDGKDWEDAAQISLKGVDLRDPKISLMPDGRLMLLMGGSVYDDDEKTQRRKFMTARTHVSFSKDGVNWTPPQPIAIDEKSWLWRVTWQDEYGYGFSYPIGVKSENLSITLWRTKDGINYEKIITPQIPKECYPDETTVRFLPDNTMVALVRNENNSGPAFVGTSKPPYIEWKFVNAGKSVQGPNFLVLSENLMVYSGRDFAPGQRTVVGFMTLEKCLPVVYLPSKGDTSYPGMAFKDGIVYVSYYSTHEEKTAIYFAKLKLVE
ncbi:MAG: glycoside hydrolase [Verrucomicrobiae bacterium]|nr:glycoside hydrolase [Verrucomicrobiae bacterium]